LAENRYLADDALDRIEIATTNRSEP